MDDLFGGPESAPRDGAPADDATRPLADRLRPRTLAEVVGQDHLLGPDGPIGRMIAAGRLSSMILWGPPGCGKTTIARLLAKGTRLAFQPLSAVFSGVADLRKAFDAAAKLRRAGLDYHDLAQVVVHPDLDDALGQVGRVFAFTTQSTRRYTDVEWADEDALLFGPEPTGLPEWARHHPRVSDQVRIPMLPGRRSMNLSNAAAVATYEAWRRLGFPGGV